jgi:hypothetical protein
MNGWWWNWACVGLWPPQAIKYNFCKHIQSSELLRFWTLLNTIIRILLILHLILKATVFWEVTSCSLVYHYKQFGRTYCIILQGSQQLEATGSFKTLEMVYQTTRCYIPEDRNLYSDHCKNQKCCNSVSNQSTCATQIRKAN